MAATQAGIYARISTDRDLTFAGVDRQRVDCLELCERHRWQVSPDHIYLDPNKSAYRKRKPTGEWARLMADLEAGAIDVVVGYHVDRFFRRPDDLEALIDLVEARPAIQVATVASGDFDQATASGRMQGRIEVTVARHASERAAERIKRKHQAIAEAGTWKGGPRPYGYRTVAVKGEPTREEDKGKLVVVPEEAEVIRWAAERVLAGDSVHAVCGVLNERGTATAQGAQWRPATLVRLLRAPTIAGRRDYLGKDIGKAQWEPILDEVTHARLVGALAPQSRPVPARVSWLTGATPPLLICGNCGHSLRTQRRQKTWARVYACPPGAGHGGCGKISAQAEPVELAISEALFVAMDGVALAKRAAPKRRLGPKVEDPVALQAQLDELAADYGAGNLGPSEWRSARVPLQARLDQALASRLAETESAVILPFVRPGTLKLRWPELTLDQRRAITSAVVEKITVNPALRKGRNFDAGRLDILWRV